MVASEAQWPARSSGSRLSRGPIIWLVATESSVVTPVQAGCLRRLVAALRLAEQHEVFVHLLDHM
jgi:hypothetical protein